MIVSHRAFCKERRANRNALPAPFFPGPGIKWLRLRVLGRSRGDGTVLAASLGASPAHGLNYMQERELFFVIPTYRLRDVGETVDRVLARTRYFAKNRGIVLDAARPDVAIYARCHPTAAEQAITNLVENAIAYGDAGGHVAVVLEADEGRKSFSLVVADDGPGVLPAELPRLAERTFRSDEARQRDPSGSGLGLAITSEVCGRCGWTLSFDRQEPRGLRVEIAGPTIVPPAQAQSRG